MASELFSSDEESMLKLVKSVTVFQINTTNQLVENLQTLGYFNYSFSSIIIFLRQRLTLIEDDIIEKNVKLIIIDSLASVVRRDFPNEYMLERAVRV